MNIQELFDKYPESQKQLENIETIANFSNKYLQLLNEESQEIVKKLLRYSKNSQEDYNIYWTCLYSCFKLKYKD